MITKKVHKCLRCLISDNQRPVENSNWGGGGWLNGHLASKIDTTRKVSSGLKHLIIIQGEPCGSKRANLFTCSQMTGNRINVNLAMSDGDNVGNANSQETGLFSPMRPNDGCISQ